MPFTSLLKSDPLPWLLEPDPANPAIRYFTLRALRLLKHFQA